MNGKKNALETKLDEIFARKAPKLPEGGKNTLVKWAPWISLIAGVLSLFSAWSLWNWARVANGLLNYTTQFCNGYSVATYSTYCPAVPSRFSLWLWLAVIFLAIEGVLYLLAYSGLRDRKKSGWNYLYYGALVNVAYAVVSLFTNYDKVGHFVGGLVGSAIAFYILFQIRSAYLGKRVDSAEPKTDSKV